MIVREVMSAEPWATNVTSSLRHVLRLLAEADVRHLPILSDGALVGIISDRDLLALTGLSDASDDPEARRRALAEPASSVMSSNLITVHPDTEVAEAIDLMIEHRIGAIPVVEPGSAKLLGIVSYVDVLRAARDVL
jgi:CBS-domain-containing membrane protein